MLRAIMSSPFYPVDTKQSFPKLEEKILAFWQTSSVFEESPTIATVRAVRRISRITPES